MFIVPFLAGLSDRLPGGLVLLLRPHSANHSQLLPEDVRGPVAGHVLYHCCRQLYVRYVSAVGVNRMAILHSPPAVAGRQHGLLLLRCRRHWTILLLSASKRAAAVRPRARWPACSRRRGRSQRSLQRHRPSGGRAPAAGRQRLNLGLSHGEGSLPLLPLLV